MIAKILIIFFFPLALSLSEFATNGPSLGPLKGVFFPILRAGVIAKTQAFYRLEGEPKQLKYSDTCRCLAFTEDHGQSLSILESHSAKVLLVTKHFVGPAFLWSPDGLRLFYRELSKNAEGDIESRIMAYDLGLKKSLELKAYTGAVGLLNLDPRDYKLQYFGPEGIESLSINLPGLRVRDWQKSTKPEDGRFILSSRGAYWLSYGGLVQKTLAEARDETIESFTISAKGNIVAWASSDGFIYGSQEGKPPVKIAKGKDPSFHPSENWLLFSRFEYLGTKIIGTDLYLVDWSNQRLKLLTHTSESQERWPTWADKGQKIYYGLEGSTDIYELHFQASTL